jgi:flagellar biosynthesis protein FliQ|tara:strand:+ start:2193 stop:2399 length:207 start_codon:yes stop_codon:yes gene_type:complete
MTTRKKHKLVIQAVIVMAFVFGLIVALIAKQTGDLEMGIIFIGAIQIIILLAILYVLEHIIEFIEVHK